MGHAGDAYDNALCESFFATLECELLDRRRFPTQAEARTAVFDFIEGWYNRTGGIPAWTIVTDRLCTTARCRRIVRKLCTVQETGSTPHTRRSVGYRVRVTGSWQAVSLAALDFCGLRGLSA
jgi:hypothetical protein